MEPTEGSTVGPPASAGRLQRTAAPLAAGEVLADRFLLREVLGHGATGTVFAALDTAVGQKVAIKLLHPELDDATTLERMRREVRAARHGHPNLVAVFDLHEIGDRLFVSMELVEGRSLKALLAEDRRLGTERTVSIVRQVASGLAHLHAQGIVHRDVKPGNILITPQGTAKLCDMGLARPLDRGMTVTMTEMVVGTPAYMAPEQGLGDDLTPASDVYSLGVCLYQCLTGKVPLNSDNAVATLTRRQRERPPAVRRARPDCPRWLGRLVRQMMEPRPADRPSAHQVERALSTSRAWPRPRRRSVALAAVAVSVVAAAVLAAPWALQRETVRFEVAGAAVHGVDDDGRRTWSFQLPAPPMNRVVEGDLDGDGVPELVATGRVSVATADDSSEPPKSWVVAVDRRGVVVTRLDVQDLITAWGFPYAIDLSTIPFVLDLDGDGLQEIVLVCQHVRFYPTSVLIYWPRWDRWERTLEHPGHLSVIAPGTTDGRPGLRFTGVNNLLAFTPVYGEIALSPPGDRSGDGGLTSGLSAPPRGILDRGSVGAWSLYVPLEESVPAAARPGDRILTAPDGSVHFGNAGGSELHLDRFANPVPGPNADRDLRQLRRDFINNLHRLHRNSSPITAQGVRSVIEHARSEAGPLLAEHPYDVILSVVGARALAVVGDLPRALAMLRDAEHLGDEDVLYLEGHLQAISGDLDGARTTVLRLIDDGESARSHFDGLFLLLEIGAASRDHDTVARVLERARRESFRSEDQVSLHAAMAARARLWWDETTPTDGEVWTSALVPEGDALGCLARWRQGRVRADDGDAVRRAIDRNPDGAGLGWIALATVHLARSEPVQALAALDAALAVLEPTVAYDFISHQDTVLARALRVEALAALGEVSGARAQANGLADSLDPQLLPGIIVTEALDTGSR